MGIFKFHHQEAGPAWGCETDTILYLPCFLEEGNKGRMGHEGIRILSLGRDTMRTGPTGLRAHPTCSLLDLPDKMLCFQLMSKLQKPK